MRKNILSAAAVTLSLCVVGCSGAGKTGSDKETKAATESVKVELSGAGATFPLPYYNMSFEAFQEKSGNKVSYGGIGSGGGIRNLKDEVVDFAGSDAFLSEKEQAEMKETIHIPTCMGAVVMAYNVPGLGELNLSGELIADIFAGNITQWNDARIAELNKGMQLPDKKIIPVYRSDGSGTTFIFTDYLTKVSSSWSEKFGAAKSVNFPAGQAAKGNPGVAGVIGQTPYSIGYIGSEYAFAQKIPYASIRNQRGEMIKPTSESISASASGIIPADTRTMITNADAAGAYPISCFTWIIIYKEQGYAGRSKDQAKGLISLLKYMLSDEAQKMTPLVHYAPLPDAAIKQSLKNIDTITYNGERINL